MILLVSVSCCHLMVLDSLHEIMLEMFTDLFHRFLNILISRVVVEKVVIEAAGGWGWNKILRMLLYRHHVAVGWSQESHGCAATAGGQHGG